ncbi:hypothetical protein BA173_06700 [Rickettsia sp. MEAM1 (Bemisia tabaci)]|uniref:hypothetical protein n=1 Tax=unclassified Rickettsia TaxID=114295 RepID=UPI0008297C8B|nr:MULTISPECIES: hypothetical protein [unclassified Rickettsia]ASX28450.1 hypothetical protein BA173_06700 [Rickettsia sp. MEAM1 (Bemisia tabaci)]ODA37262.1 hypothetical protein A8V34_03105 [Rickettsia sp. wq]ODA37641.1 hypothetical protein A8V33_01705 [Rickettsia sp. wb]
MFRKFILASLLCLNSYKILADDKKLEDLPNKILVNISENYNCSDSLVKNKKQDTEKKKLQISLPDDQIQIKGIRDNFEIVERISGDDIHTARKRKRIQDLINGDTPAVINWMVEDKATLEKKVKKNIR